jgi:hypothetical protein
MARSKEKPFNGGQWTTARFNAFIKGALRAAARRWPPKHIVKKEAWVRRGVYQCAGYDVPPHEVPITVNRENNVFVDHIEPVVDPVQGFQGWDLVIERMFVEKEGLQILCKECHQTKTGSERSLARESKKSSSLASPD